MKRSIVVGAAIVAGLIAATGGLAAQRYLITSSRQVEPGAISYRNLDRHARRLIARDGRRGRRGPVGRRGPSGPQGATGARGPTGAAGPAGATGPTGAAGASGRPGPEGPSGANALAKASGLVAWTTDPGLISMGKQDSSGTIHGGSVYLEQGETIHWLAEFLAADGSGVTHGQFAIYDARVDLVAETANTPSAFESPVQDETWVKLSLSSPYTVPASGLYYLVDFLAGSSTPTMGVAVGDTGLSARNVLPDGIRRAVRDGSGLSALPATLTLSSTGETRCMLAG